MEHAVVPGMTREQKLSEWIEQYSDPILRTCCLYLSDMQMAEDALQETWIKAWKYMDDPSRIPVANEKAWLFRIAMNTCRDYQRTVWFRHSLPASPPSKPGNRAMRWSWMKVDSYSAVRKSGNLSMRIDSCRACGGSLFFCLCT